MAAIIILQRLSTMMFTLQPKFAQFFFRGVTKTLNWIMMHTRWSFVVAAAAVVQQPLAMLLSKIPSKYEWWWKKTSQLPKL
jgi:hypothetical protein